MLPVLIYEPVPAERDRILAFLRSFSDSSDGRFTIIDNVTSMERAVSCLDQERGVLLLIIGVSSGAGAVPVKLEEHANGVNRDSYCLYWLHDMSDLPEIAAQCCHPSGFILPPPEQTRFDAVLRRIWEDYASLGDNSGESFLSLQCGGTTHRLSIASIQYFEALDKRLNIWTDRQCLSVYETIGNMEKLLGDRFFRCHRSYLINYSQLESVDYAGMELKLTSGTRLPLSRSAKTRLKQRISQEEAAT